MDGGAAEKTVIRSLIHCIAASQLVAAKLEQVAGTSYGMTETPLSASSSRSLMSSGVGFSLIWLISGRVKPVETSSIPWDSIAFSGFPST